MNGPLLGVRVVELAGIGPGPFAAMLLADLGADVVRVDRPTAAEMSATDPARDVLNRGKRSISVDLKEPDGVATVLALAARADILVEGWRPGVAERLGVGPDACLGRNPALVYGRMTGWGQAGPLAASAGHDIDYIAISGGLHPIGPAQRPSIPLNLVGDFGGGSLYLVVGVLAALLSARATGQGQVVDAAIVDGVAHLTSIFAGLAALGRWQPTRAANLLDGGAPFYDVYETADGGHLAVGALERRFYTELLRGLGLADDPTLPSRDDLSRWPELRARFAATFATRTRAQWVAVFEGTDACVAPVLSLAEAPGHPHLVARGTFVERFGIVQPGVAPRFSATPAQVGGPPPAPGADAEAIRRDWKL